MESAGATGLESPSLERVSRSRRGGPTGALLATVATVAFVLLAPLTAERLAAAGGRAPGVAENWKDRLESIDKALLAGEWKVAKRKTNRLLGEMCDRIESGEAAAWFLGTAAALRGIAEAGLGNERDALWDWHLAATLYPPHAELDLRAYGRSAEILSAAPSASKPPQGGAALVDGDGEFTSPKRRISTLPKYPVAQRLACLAGPVVVQAVIGEDGVPRFPALLTRHEMVLGFAALDALRDWRFEPARLQGEPVKFTYNLTVNYQIPLCDNPLARFRKSKQREEN